MKAWIANRYSGYTPGGKFWLTVGLIVMTVDMAMGYQGGVSVGTFWHGVGYAALAAGFAFLPDAAYEEFEHKRFGSAAVIALLCVPIGIKAYEQQLTYSAGVRHGEIQLTSVVNQRYDGAQDDVARNRAELTALQGALVKLQSDNPWATTVKADGLRARLAAAQKAIDLEAARKGCKAKCLAEMEKKADLEKQIAIVEKADETQKRIEFLQASIDKKRDVANKAEHRQSINVDVAKTTAKLFNVARGLSAEDAMKTDAVSLEVATMGSAGLGSLSLLMLAPGALFLAGRRRIKHVTPEPDLTETTGQPRARPAIVSSHIPSVTAHTTSIADLRARMHSLQAAA